MMIYSVGHKNPDTDTITSAIAVADLWSKVKEATQPVAQGEIAPETKFVLDKFGCEAPAIMTDATDKKIILVDHSDLSQSMDNLAKGEVIAVVDHHKLGDVTTPNPLEMWVWPVGCTGTIINAMYKFYNVEIPKNIAGIVLCAILSDTVLFKSVTTTEADKAAVAELAKIAGVDDVMALGMEMFNVKSAVAGASMNDLIFRDYKDFDMSGTKIGVGQLEVVDLSVFDDIKADLYAELEKVKADGRHSCFLLLTDIMKEGSEMLIVSDDPSVVEKAFGVAPKGTSVYLEGVMSRKKQVVPNFEKAFSA
ncbi:manganese-dependent inorganic pyrophosphatase [Desulfovibrio sp. UCD-KL4C]|uniref:manganese-dependent inorganic pyrophosphatase n=1 Tax=Desulfovibrio sp. UCD-KL4C TaxID=2578120 RepID=UPI0025B85AB6|nr:manganese-dependent inorganic pyrophosphatase [Desulfovibrio sp. UCD-KL4C]